jgi:hypothetical protein
MSIVAIVEDDTIKLPPGVHVPDGTAVCLEFPKQGVASRQWPESYFERTAGALGGECLERPEQGEVPLRRVFRKGLGRRRGLPR